MLVHKNQKRIREARPTPSGADELVSRTRRVSPSVLERIKIDAAGIDCRSVEHFVAARRMAIPRRCNCSRPSLVICSASRYQRSAACPITASLRRRSSLAFAMSII
jgi:transcription initiation factor TFIIIB Brf1 subunit/transcription initiation factor TFIIB